MSRRRRVWAAPAWAWLAATTTLSAAEPIVFTRAGAAEPLTLELTPAAGAVPAPHPAILLVPDRDSAGGSGCCADWLARAGYHVFTPHYRTAAAYPAAVDDVQRAVRFVRLNAARWQVDARRIALVGFGFGGYLSNLAAMAPSQRPAKGPGGSPGHAIDQVDRQSAAVQAVVSFAAPSDLRAAPVPDGWQSWLGPLIEAGNVEGALAEASPVMHIRLGAPPFLVIHGDADADVPFAQSTHWQYALQSAGIACELILIRGGGHDVASWSKLAGLRPWEAETLGWLARALGLEGSGRGSRPRGR